MCLVLTGDKENVSCVSPHSHSTVKFNQWTQAISFFDNNLHNLVYHSCKKLGTFHVTFFFWKEAESVDFWK